MAFCTKHNLKIHSHDHQICNKSCWQPYRLKEHTMTHTGEKSFNCTVCTKSFSQAGNLKTHFRVLSKENPTVVHYVLNHFLNCDFLSTHPGEKPYKSLLFIKSFVYPSTVHFRNIKKNQRNIEIKYLFEQ